MKKILILLLLAICLSVSCAKVSDDRATTTTATPDGSAYHPSGDAPTTQGSGVENDPEYRNSSVLGTYTGGFEATAFNEKKDYVYENRITVSIDSLTATTLNGHSVVAGNSRPFKGDYQREGKLLKVEVAEPGDDRYDGRFSFTVDPERNSISGIWKANDEKLEVTARKYTLVKRQFAYDASLNLPEDVQWTGLYEKNPKFPDQIESLTEEVTKFNASVRELTKRDVENLYQGDLEIIRNAIYARHGYSFKNRRLRFVFDQFVPWYMPMKTDVRGELTAIEKKNEELLKRYEDHAEKYYDVYGR